MENTYVDYEFANKIITKYYQEKYPDYNISTELTYEKRIKEDAWGWDNEYYIFWGKLFISKEEVVFGKKISVKEERYLDDDEVEKILIESFQKELDSETYIIKSVHPTKENVGIEINIKEKKIIKKGE